MTPKQYAESLKLLAEFYDDVPDDFPVPYVANSFNCYIKVFNNKAEQLAQAIKVTQILGGIEKEYFDNFAYLKRKFGELELQFVLDRDAVCTRKVVGTKVVPEQTLPARIEEIVEWDCHPLLQPPGIVAETSAT